MKLSPEDLNPDPCLSYPTNTYTWRVTTTPRMRDGKRVNVKNTIFFL